MKAPLFAPPESSPEAAVPSPSASATGARARRAFRTVSLLTVLAVLAVATLLARHLNQVDGYRHYLLDERPAISLRLAQLSPAMDEAAVARHFAGLPLRCVDASPPLDPLVDRVCRVDISRADGIPAMRLAIDFNQGHLVAASVDLPWWSHRTALRQLLARCGPPESMEVDQAAKRVVQWRSGSGPVQLDREPGWDPLVSLALRWRADAQATLPEQTAPAASDSPRPFSFAPTPHAVPTPVNR